MFFWSTEAIGKRLGIGPNLIFETFEWGKVGLGHIIFLRMFPDLRPDLGTRHHVFLFSGLWPAKTKTMLDTKTDTSFLRRWDSQIYTRIHFWWTKVAQLSDIKFDKNTMLWGSADGKDVHLITLKTEKLEAIKGSRISWLDLMKLPTSIWVFPKIGVPQNRWFIMENPIKMDDLRGTTIFGNIHLLAQVWKQKRYQNHPPVSTC